MSKKFVIAGNHEQAKHWINNHLKKRQAAGETTLSSSEYVIVHGSDVLRGRGEVHGVFVGTWRDRMDIEEIVEILFTQTIHVSPQLEKIRKELRLKSTRPKPKTIQTAIDAAGQRMADEIDREVISQMGQTVSYEQLVPNLIKAIQELNDKLKQLESR
jgi:hypothetical protein